MINVERSVGAAPSRVWDVMSAISHWADLLPTVQKVTARPGTVEGHAGARYALKQPGLPTLVYEVTEWLPGTGFTWIATTPGVRTIGTHQIVSTPEGCTLRLGLRWDGPLAGAIRLLYGSRTERFVRQEAETFARLAAPSPS